jgi:hypothetical protein
VIALYLIAAHLVGDFVLQTRWQAAGKFTDRRLRLRHVTAYCVPFVAVLLVIPALDGTWLDEHRGIFYPANPGRVPQKLAFLALLFVLHYATDSRRFRSTLGDVVAWVWMTPSGTDPATVDALALQPMAVYRTEVPNSPPPNPWPPVPILIDQTLHICQIAILGALFLS